MALLLLAALLLVPVLVMAGCGSMPKPRVQRELADLAKNARWEPVGLGSTPIEVDLGRGPVRVEAIHGSHGPLTESGRTPVVLVHGTPGTLYTWTEVVFGDSGVPGLAEDRAVHCLDVVGHGMTEPKALDYGFQRCADWVVAYLETLDGPVDLVGHSYGGEFAWRAALDRPDLVRRLVLMDSAGLERADGDWLPEEEKMRKWPGATLGWVFNGVERIRGALQPHFGGPVPDDRARELFLVCENADNWKAMVQLARDENGERAAELARLGLPTLLLWGERDVAYDVDRYPPRFLELLPDAELVVVPDCGHYPQEERPARTIEALREFLDR